MAVDTKHLCVTVFHRTATGGGSNSRFEHPTDHASTIIEAMKWLGVVAEAHGCAYDAQSAFVGGVEQRKTFEARAALTQPPTTASESENG